MLEITTFMKGSITTKIKRIILVNLLYCISGGLKYYFKQHHIPEPLTGFFILPGLFSFLCDVCPLVLLAVFVIPDENE